MKEYNDRLELKHDAINAAALWDEFVRRCVPDDVQQRIRHAFRKEIKRSERDPWDLSSEDEEHVAPEQLHLESCVDAQGNPIEFDGEHVLSGKKTGLRHAKHTNPQTAENLSVDSFVLLQPDPGFTDKLWIVQVKSVNVEPDNQTTWAENNGQKWHYFGGWWELVDKNSLGRICKSMSPEGVVRVHKDGTNTTIDWTDPVVIAELTKSRRKQWLQQYFDRDSWGVKEIAVNVMMNGKKDGDRAFNKNVVKKLALDWPRQNYDNDKPRPLDSSEPQETQAPPAPKPSVSARTKSAPHDSAPTQGPTSRVDDAGNDRQEDGDDPFAGGEEQRPAKSKRARANGPPLKKVRRAEPPQDAGDRRDSDVSMRGAEDFAGGAGGGGDVGQSSSAGHADGVVCLHDPHMVSRRVQASRIVSRQTVQGSNSITQRALMRAMQKTTGQEEDGCEDVVEDNRVRRDQARPALPNRPKRTIHDLATPDEPGGDLVLQNPGGSGDHAETTRSAALQAHPQKGPSRSTGAAGGGVGGGSSSSAAADRQLQHDDSRGVVSTVSLFPHRNLLFADR
jgi:hypothetical protein